MNRLLIFPLLALLLLSGCISLGGNPPQPTPNVTPSTPAPEPSFSLVEPVAGDTILANDDTADVSVVLSVQNLVIKPAVAAKNPGEGHFRINLDGGAFVSFFSKSYTVQGVGLGTHAIKVELVNNDNTPYYPPLSRSVTFEVKTAHPAYQPQNHEVDMSDSSYEPQNITIKVGDSITWENQGSYSKSATSTGNFDTKVIAPGSSATLNFTKEGTFNYFSLTYTMMKGTVTVESNGSG